MSEKELESRDGDCRGSPASPEATVRLAVGETAATKPCEDCKGTGFGFKGRVNLAVPIDKTTNLKSVKEYVERVLFCDTCKGTGKDYSK